MQRMSSMDQRIEVLRLLVHQWTGSPSTHPMPELVALVTPLPGGTDAMDRTLGPAAWR